MDDELSQLNVKRSDIARIKNSVMDKIDKVIGQFTKVSTCSEYWSSPKLVRPDSMVDTHTGKISSENDSM